LRCFGDAAAFSTSVEDVRGCYSWLSSSKDELMSKNLRALAKALVTKKQYLIPFIAAHRTGYFLSPKTDFGLQRIIFCYTT
jgi:hypothetical protein